MKPWSLTSWQDYPYLQAACYCDETGLSCAVETLSHRPPLVPILEIQRLKNIMAKAASGLVFILQGGNCAESFQDCHAHILNNQLQILLSMSDILENQIQKPVICTARMAGQYAKPRSNEIETQNGITLPSYRGDLINSTQFTASDRAPDPARLLKAYDCSAWTLDHLRKILPQKTGIDFYTAHEALHLHYEQALTRQAPDGLWYNQSTHFPWIGIRTAQPETAHIELLRGVHNPVGIKIGPHYHADRFQTMLQQLNPAHEPGRISLITRFGAAQVETCLPALIQHMQSLKTPVTWICDPMHGNTEITKEGIKTRHIDNILSELQQTIAIHQTMNSVLGGVHLELTGEHVTECLGGANNLQTHHLKDAYFSLMDPRLNHQQSLDIAAALGRLL